MVSARLPANESLRLKSLERARLLDTAPERIFDIITSRAAEICGVPMALISLVDENRQWFKSRVGVGVTETPRDVAFCSHAILNEDLMIVPDALSDDRFRDNPLVTGDPNIRFYAGMPLVTNEGCALGTLCVMDRAPRELSEEQKRSLRTLAESTRVLFEMRSPMAEILSKAAEATEEGVTICDARQPDMPVIYANPAFYRITGYSELEVLGRNCRFLQGPDTDPAAVEKIRSSIHELKNCVVELLNYTKAGKPFWNRLSLVPLTDPAGALTYVAGLQSDITEAREARAARDRLDGMIAAMNTVNDIVFNFMTTLQWFRMEMDGCGQADRTVLWEFDAIFEDTREKLSKINALTSFKTKIAAAGIAVLDTG